MIYADYARRKMHNVVKLGTAEGYPLVINNAKGKKLKDYTIEGNTEYGENLFNYTEPLTNSIKADADGWFDVTVDNTTGTSSKTVWCATKPNYRLKTNTQYQMFVEVAEKSGNVNNVVATQWSSFLSQLLGGVGSTITANSIGTKTGTIQTKDSFENVETMLRGNVSVPAGKSGHIKFRVAVYESQKNEFIPYTKTSVGDLTDNLFNYTEPLTNNIKADDDGWFDVTIDATSSSTAIGADCQTTISLSLSTSSYYYLICEISEMSGDFEFRPFRNVPATQMYHALRLKKPVIGYNYLGTYLTKSSFDNCITMLGTNVLSQPGKSGHIKFRIAVYETEKDYFEPYNKYKIPILVNGTNNETIYLNAPLADGESINYKADNLPDIVLNKDSNTITTDTAVKPKKIIAKYYKK